MIPIVSAEQMRSLDQQAIEQLEIPGMVLMENAGRGTVNHMEQKWGPVLNKRVLIFIGPGNNGGDGLVIARSILNRGGRPELFYLVSTEELTGDAGHNQRIVEHIGIASTLIDEEFAAEKVVELYEGPYGTEIHSIVDAIFGIGLSRPVTGHYLQTINSINTLSKRQNVRVVSVDIPSGMDSNTGESLGCNIHADLTVTYAFAKPAHFHHGGQDIGELKIVDIGIPPILSNRMEIQGELLTKNIRQHLPSRTKTAHKGSNGHLLILAGSTGKTGAAILCAQAAIRSGSGLVTLAVPHTLNQIFESSLIEAMTIALVHSDAYFTVDDYSQIEESMAGKNALVLGPGIGTEQETESLILRLYVQCPLPMVVDADALNILAAHPDVIQHPGGPRILTPHPGEMARLLNINTKELQKDRLKAALWLDNTGKQPVITVLKGAGSIVASATGKWRINSSGNPGMGSGGMGDVLAGMIGGFLVQGLEPWEAASLGVYLHGFCGDLLAEDCPVGFNAGDLASSIPQAMAKLNSD